MAKYIEFEHVFDKAKTSIWTVRTKADHVTLGVIEWHCAWRRYCFYPHGNTIYEQTCFEETCLRDIADFLEKATKEHKAKHAKKKKDKS